MKIAASIPTKKSPTSERKSGFLPPPIPLARPEKRELSKEEYLTMKLRSIPDKATSPTYDLNVPYFDSGTPEEWLKLLENLKRVFTGQNLTTASTKYAMTRRLLMGDALSQFDAKAEELRKAAEAPEGGVWEETDKNLTACLNSVTEKVMPKRALQTQKRYMRRIIRKPVEMKIREYLTRFMELNKYLEQFPPFDEEQNLPDDEVMEHAEFAIPNSWQNQMVMHNFNTVENSMADFIEFCERLEFTENMYNSTHKSQRANTKNGNNGSTSTKKDGKSNKSGHKRKTGNFNCLYHGPNSTHNTDDCKVLKAQAERMAAAHAGKGGKYKHRESTSDHEKKKRKEFTSFATNVVEKIIKKMKTSRSKEKNKEDNFNMEEFNYEAFRELSVSSSDNSETNNDSSSSDL